MTVGQIISTAHHGAGLSQRDLAARLVTDDGRPVSLRSLPAIARDRRR